MSNLFQFIGNDKKCLEKLTEKDLTTLGKNLVLSIKLFS